MKTFISFFKAEFTVYYPHILRGNLDNVDNDLVFIWLRPQYTVICFYDLFAYNSFPSFLEHDRRYTIGMRRNWKWNKWYMAMPLHPQVTIPINRNWKKIGSAKLEMCLQHLSFMPSTFSVREQCLFYWYSATWKCVLHT